ncbi:MAG TPA: asparaginase domain-containing protein [Opitutaceae bacterium]|nr:asparaginase domain-containing protein [Opitutaceae bacterium]
MHFCSRFVRPLYSLCLCGSIFSFTLSAADKPKIAIFSGPTATIQNNEPFITSNKAREKYGLPLIKGADGEPAIDALRPQRLAAPAKIYIEAFSAHPLETDVAELYAPPDGYLDAQGVFSKEKKSPTDKPVYEVTLDPKDGLYPLPYMARQSDGKAWDETYAYKGAPFEKSRQTFYPDASRIFEELERAGGHIFEKASYDFYRAAPSAGYPKGLPASKRTDVGTGDIPPEKLGEDFFPYGPYGSAPPRTVLAKATNIVQHAMASGKYSGGIWLEGTPNIEDSSYWLNLLIDTDKPIVTNAAQRDRGKLSPDGDANIVDAITYILSKTWADSRGHDQLGEVVLQDNLIYASREITKGDARPGGYIITGGDGGLLGNTTSGPVVAYIPNRKHTYTSDVRVTQLPLKTVGVKRIDGKVTTVVVPIKDAAGDLLPSAVPNVTIVKGARWSEPDASREPDKEVSVLAQLDKDLTSDPLSGIVAEGNQGGSFVPPMEAAFNFIALHGIPVVKTNRGGTAGYVRATDDNLVIEGMNLTSTKARLLLMACLMKFGTLPPAADPKHPSPAELTAIKEKLKLYQAVFNTH